MPRVRMPITVTRKLVVFKEDSDRERPMSWKTATTHCLQVLEADLDTQQAVAPLLQNKVLRRIIQSFTNDNKCKIDFWACNPEVLRLLHEAKRKMDEGFVSEEEMESLLLAHLQVCIDPHCSCGI